jgi:hypothetical protein
MSSRAGVPTAGYSGTTLVQKLGLAAGKTVAAVSAPAHLEDLLGPLPPGVRIRSSVRPGQHVDLVLAFFTRRRELERSIVRLQRALGDDGTLWIAWPKKASKVPTDVTEDVVRDVVLPTGWVDTKVCAIDATWSGLKLVLRRELRGAGRGS